MDWVTEEDELYLVYSEIGANESGVVYGSATSVVGQYGLLSNHYSVWLEVSSSSYDTYWSDETAREYLFTALDCVKEYIDPQGDVSLELTYPAGQSPKVFTKGWVFGAKCTYNENGTEVDISDRVSWGGTGTFNPNKGSRSYPTFNSPEIAGQHTIELSVEKNGEEYKKEFQVEAVPATNYARLTDMASCPADAHGCPADPLPVVGPITTGSPNISIQGLPAARAGDIGRHSACCGASMYTITAGDENVLIDGRPAARWGDQTQHCGGVGRIIQGSVGPGPETFSTPLKKGAHTCKIPATMGLREDGGGTIAGKVTDTVGAGIGGIGVTAYGDTHIDAWGTITDENGEYLIGGLPDDSYRVQFQGESKGYSNQWYSSKSSWDTAELVMVTAPNKTTGIDAELPLASETTTTIISNTTTTSSSGSCPSEVTYGEHSEHTERLRHFRDNLLSQTPEGQEIIRLYYQWSPVIVKAMENNEEFREEVKEIVDGVLELIDG